MHLKSTVFKLQFLLFIFLFNSKVFCKEYPEIRELSYKNPLFQQYIQDVESSNKTFSSGKKVVPYFYTYTCTEKDTLQTVAARCCIPYDTIATVNSIQENSQNLNGKKLFLPTASGLFVSLEPETSIDFLLYSEYSEALKGNAEIYNINGKDLAFFSGAKFSPADRTYFLVNGMKLPLEKSVLTSAFGMRVSPISGKWKFHNGIDMASPLGSAVFACKSGTVKSILQNDEIYGKCVVISHSNGMTSLYAHLGKITVEKNQVVQGGQKIGEVGLTGLTTGPHLHFEIKNNGKPENPQLYLKDYN